MASWKILVADDDPNVREVVGLYCAKQQIQMIEAPDGEAALELIEKERPDMIILDVRMPKADGFIISRQMFRRFDIPFLFLTSNRSPCDRDMGIGLGAKDYITKPFSPRELVARIKAILSSTESGPI
ncbi:response regulator [Paenibacillus filicis]|uniref:Response regulator n=1 Tax=Paenibacillus gyeongsangnamensis TaxID=3388067 RepID=A0ABT4QIT4_9BACL|nr:response regulator [Paenibacillus filicis]MCZ8516763.1 response regulator [Paenibacillus filicis]